MSQFAHPTGSASAGLACRGRPAKARTWPIDRTGMNHSRNRLRSRAGRAWPRLGPDRWRSAGPGGGEAELDAGEEELALFPELVLLGRPPAVPPACQKERAPAVSSGQSRSLREVRDAGHMPLTWGGEEPETAWHARGQGFKSPQLHQAQRIGRTPAQGRLPEICQSLTDRVGHDTMSADRFR